MILLVTVAGCGGPKPLPVSGVVTLDGKPLADAGVLFCPIDGGPVASATTDADGKFHPATINTPGVMPGRYRVTVTKESLPPPSSMFDAVPPAEQVKRLIPEKYGRPETSGLEATVDRDHREFSFPLSSRP